MKKSNLLFFLLLLLQAQSFAQTKITGQVRSKDGSASIPGATIAIKNGASTRTDENGNFGINVSSLPVTLFLSSIGYQTKTIIISSGDAGIIKMDVATKMEDPFVLTTSGIRKRTRIIDMPVSIENYGAIQIRNAPTDYYGLAGYKKGIGITESSITFKTISTRGFNGSGSTRVNQLVDGMDNQAPGLNFFVGNFAGVTELDVDNIDILPGASSALYGPGGMNGTILITSKNPFQYQGLDIQLKEGVNNIDKSQRSNASSFHDFSLRYAKAFKNKFAFKIGVQYIKAIDWLANDSSNYSRNGTVGKVIPGNRSSDPNYDGVNVYGDETSVDVRQFVGGIAQSYPVGSPEQIAIFQLYNSMQNPTMVSRTGYAEKDIIDPETKNIKLSGALHYKITEKIEAQLAGYWGTGNTVYTGNNRYALKGIKIGQYKIELKHPDWFLRSYTTQENAGEAYSATVATQIFNEAWKPSYNPANPTGSWYTQYAGAYVQAYLNGLNDITAHNAARAFADQGRPAPGSPQFKEIFDQVRKTPIPNGGLFLEKSQLWMTEGQYNFSKAIKFVDLVVGGNVKKYLLDSKGTLFIDTAGKAIAINEYGAYAQLTKKMLNDALTLSVSGRMDKNEDFKEHFTPRATALINLAKDNNLRVSYQTAYRFPSTQQKYIRLNVGDYMLLGGLPWVMQYMQADKNPVYEVGSTTPYVYKEFKPENMKSFEIGYKGLIAKKLLIDAYSYFGNYTDFLGRNALYQPSSGRIFSTVVNSTTKVKTHGFGLGLDYQLPQNFSAFLNGYSDVLTDVPSGFQSYFNTPKYRVNAGFANSGLGKANHIGFNVLMHWQDAFMWDGELANGPIDAYATVDAQVSYKLAKNSMIKLGGTNIFNHYYKTGYGNPSIGGLYYVSLGIHLQSPKNNN
jgi:outer membrane receptor protein involved in Fe transport